MALLRLNTRKMSSDDDCVSSLDVKDNECAVSTERGLISIVQTDNELEKLASMQLSGHFDCSNVIFRGSSTPHHLFCSFGPFVFLLDRRHFAKPVAKLTCNDDDVNALTMSACDKFLVSGDDCGTVKVLDVDSKRVWRTLNGRHETCCFALVTRPDRPHEIISGGFDCLLFRWNLKSWRRMQKMNMNEYRTEMDLPFMNPPYVLDLCWDCDGETMVVASQDGSIHFVDGRKARLEHKRQMRNAHSSLGVTQVECLGDVGLISAGNDGFVKVWRENKDEFVASVEHGEKINALKTSVNSKELLIGDTGGAITLYRCT